MLKKIIIVSIFGAILFAASAKALTLKEFFQEPLPNVIEFMNQATAWLLWFWSKISYYADIALNWTLNSGLAKIWKFALWLWNLTKTGVLAGWSLIDQIARQLASGSGIDWQNIQWPWN